MEMGYIILFLFFVLILVTERKFTHEKKFSFVDCDGKPLSHGKIVFLTSMGRPLKVLKLNEYGKIEAENQREFLKAPKLTHSIAIKNCANNPIMQYEL